jgi:hypothetical protein
LLVVPVARVVTASHQLDRGRLLFCCFERHAERDDGVDVVGAVGFVDAPASPALACDGGVCVPESRRRAPASRVWGWGAPGCDQLPFAAHGKEGVSGSSPEEGLKEPAIGIFCCPLCWRRGPPC